MTIDLGPAATRLQALVAAVDDASLGAPTPCPDYVVGDLVEHIGGLAIAFREAAEKSTPTVGSDGAPAGDAARLEDGWRARIDADLAALAVAWREPSAWEGMTAAGGIEMPGEIAGLVALDELVVHGWDLARSLGRDLDIDEGDLGVVLDFLDGFPAESRGDAFGQPVAVGADASLLDQVVAASGRDPGWRT